MENFIKQKLHESITSILPIAAIVLLLGITLAPMSTSTFLLFLLGVLCLIAGLAIFTMGAEMSMQQLGNKIGSYLAKSNKIWLIAFISFIIGILVTVSEPDLQILAEQVSGVPNMMLILTVSVGVGIFLAIALMRIVFHISLSVLLMILPLYPKTVDGYVYCVNLWMYTETAVYNRWVYWILFLSLTATGMWILVLTQRKGEHRKKVPNRFSLVVGMITVFYLVLAREAYAAAIAILLLVVKGLLMYWSLKSGD